MSGTMDWCGATRIVGARRTTALLPLLVLVLLLLGTTPTVTFSDAAAASKQQQDPGTVSFVLVGATGNLAKKYLFQSLFDVFLGQGRDDPQLRVYAGARHTKDKSWPTIQQALAAVKCRGRHGDTLLTTECDQLRHAFAEHVQYIQLKTEEHYAALHDAIAKHGETEAARVFYLSVPPSAYPTIAHWIDQSCRPGHATPLRVALEKPFGRDFHSARELQAALRTSLKPAETMLVDHYLGKRGVLQIAEFARANRRFVSTYLRRKHVERVEIVMKETEDCSGRTRFFDAYGIVRDVMQNHLTEVLLLLAMDPGVPVSFSSKMPILSAMLPAAPSRAVLGQYAGYRTHVAHDHGEEVDTKTPTFAGVTLFIDTPRWEGTPFVMVAGKRLSERVAFARVRFKQDTSMVCTTEGCGVHQIEYHIQGHNKPPCITFWGNFPELVVPDGWSVEHNTTAHIALCPGEDVGSLSPYTELMHALVVGDRTKFVELDTLLRSWQIWTPLANTPTTPRVYEREEDVLFALQPNGALAFGDGTTPLSMMTTTRRGHTLAGAGGAGGTGGEDADSKGKYGTANNDRQEQAERTQQQEQPERGRHADEL
ncbi:hypothetical protein PTSG_02535 [Salpingoeca rosetta]|uniref:Glucose-6-phosphate 1-dehydrogenase n=1 Tax=Salpingoeca rosetta (strain ATCC 50818 / BSB-021) TaxID=946362 RepID=F2U2G9_SALR5|nr:uncharacterized protein PTSG_02535 [Salpingoeca rosetta]EGD81821.1 hypothetical protein PTSG_02535 [Salpingoeca rosetta]|eukprot:XP_004997025.1 hypothetical protein PTSG_02535 [Salpingoeca rosetta]